MIINVGKKVNVVWKGRGKGVSRRHTLVSKYLVLFTKKQSVPKIFSSFSPLCLTHALKSRAEIRCEGGQGRMLPAAGEAESTEPSFCVSVNLARD